MPDLTAKRTLVKSPPELWEELSEVDRLAWHLGAFGEITITKLEPEHTVAWEGERASGTVSIEPSGWGTRVTLRAELPQPEEAEPEPAATDPRDEAQHASDQLRPSRLEPEPTPEPDAESGADTSEPAPRPGLWGRLFRRRPEPAATQTKPHAAEAEPTPVAAEPEPLAAEPQALVAEADPEPVAADAEPQPVAADADPVALDAEAGALDAPPALDSKRARLILDEALDALGAAHHRPFSRG